LPINGLASLVKLLLLGMKNRIFILVLSLLLLVSFSSALAQTAPAQTAVNKPAIELYFFRGEGCLHCAQAEDFLGDLVKQYPQLEVRSFEVFYNNDNRQLYFTFAQAYNINPSELVVPVIFVGNQSWVGFNNGIGGAIKSAVQNCFVNACSSPQSLVVAHAQQQQSQNFTKQSLIGWIIIIGVLAIIIFILVKLFKRKK